MSFRFTPYFTLFRIGKTAGSRCRPAGFLALLLAATLSVSAVAAGRNKGDAPPYSLKTVVVPQESPLPAPGPVGPPEEEHAARRAVERESFYDPANPDLAVLQRPLEATRGMPYDANGFPDWMKALKEGSINPRMSLRGQGKMEILDMDVIMKNTKEMPNVRFPHKSHTMWLDCSNCHPEPFKPQAGSNPIRMADIFRGQFCGKCHDRVAFITFFSCVRCHSVPQGSVAAAKP
ncbi:MAG TPA: c(7)-type cytochrome triheme domain-containing protein [Rhodocyclaceae bacterium]|nr:c(7)-type cytochrome triheme domain-containing protein [Rhodocyclaceae bacterium]